jgi:hypothetical protein
MEAEMRDIILEAIAPETILEIVCLSIAMWGVIAAFAVTAVS